MLAKALHHNLIKLWSSLTGADLISILFLAVTIPHTAQVLQGYETGEWHWLAWSLAGASDIGIACGGVVSAESRVDTQARRWATLLFIGLSVGSYPLNVEHYLQARADAWWSYGLGLLLPGGILAKAKESDGVITRPFTLAAPNENGNSSKLTRQQTEAIRNRILAGELSLAQAKEQGVPEGTISSWKSRYGNQVRLN